MDPSFVEVTLPVRTGTITKLLPVIPTLAGAPAAGLSCHQRDDAARDRHGSRAPATRCRRSRPIATAPIDIGAAPTDVIRQVAVVVAGGRDGVAPQVTVVVQSGGRCSSGCSAIPVRVVGIAPGWTARVVPDHVQVQVYGPQDAIERLATAAIVVQVDVTGMRAGPHRAAPQVVLPSGGVRVLLVTPAQVAVTLLPSR